MNDVHAFATLGDIVAANPAAARVLDRLGLDYCCHGTQTLAEACAAGHIDVGVVDAVLAALDADGDTTWRDLDATALAEHILATHHAYLHEELALLDALAAKVLDVHGGR